MGVPPKTDPGPVGKRAELNKGFKDNCTFANAQNSVINTALDVMSPLASPSNPRATVQSCF